MPSLPHQSQPGMSPRLLGGAVLAWLSASALALAAGAIWMLPTLLRGAELPWLALPTGWVLGWSVRRFVRRAGPLAALLAAYALLLAALYLRCLIAGATLAGSLGIGLGEALRTAGLPTLLALARFGSAPAQWSIYLLGAVLAAATAWHDKRSSPR